MNAVRTVTYKNVGPLYDECLDLDPRLTLVAATTPGAGCSTALRALWTTLTKCVGMVRGRVQLGLPPSIRVFNSRDVSPYKPCAEVGLQFRDGTKAVLTQPEPFASMTHGGESQLEFQVDGTDGLPRSVMYANAHSHLDWLRKSLRVAQEHNAAMQHIAGALFPGARLTFHDTEFNDGSTVRLVSEDGASTAIADLGDGERTILSWALALHLQLADLPAGTDGIPVIIDDFDAHQHPSQQRHFLNTFVNLFPGCQFVISTHSPILLGEVHAEQVRQLVKVTDPDDGAAQTLCWIPTYAYGQPVQTLLQDFFNTAERNQDTACKFHRLFELLEGRQSDTAERIDTLYRSLEEQLGGLDPDLVKVATVRHFKKLLAKGDRAADGAPQPERDGA